MALHAVTAASRTSSSGYGRSGTKSPTFASATRRRVAATAVVFDACVRPAKALTDTSGAPRKPVRPRRLNLRPRDLMPHPVALNARFDQDPLSTYIALASSYVRASKPMAGTPEERRKAARRRTRELPALRLAAVSPSIGMSMPTAAFGHVPTANSNPAQVEPQLYARSKGRSASLLPRQASIPRAFRSDVTTQPLVPGGRLASFSDSLEIFRV